MKRKAGFTLVEVMVVIAIFAVIAATAGPAVVQYYQTRSSNVAATGLYSTLHLYRSLAIQKRLLVDIYFDDATDEYQIDLTDPATGIVTSLPAIFVGRVTGDAFITNDPETGTPSVDQITFTIQGSCPTGLAGAVYISNGPYTYRVRATLAGGISIHIWNEQNRIWYVN